MTHIVIITVLLYAVWCCRSCFWARSCSWPWTVPGASWMASGWPLVRQHAEFSLLSLWYLKLRSSFTTRLSQFCLFVNELNEEILHSRRNNLLLRPCLPADPCFWMLCGSDMRWLRNQVVAPLTEELVFRACMLPMLVPCAGPSIAIFTCPLFFGVGEFY